MLQRGEAGQSHFQEKEKISVIYFLLSSLAFLFFHKWKRSPAQSCWAGSKGSIALGANRPCLLLAHLIPTSPKETGMSWQTLRRQRVLSIPCPVPWAPPLPSPGAAAFSPQDFRQTHHKLNNILHLVLISSCQNSLRLRFGLGGLTPAFEQGAHTELQGALLCKFNSIK